MQHTTLREVRVQCTIFVVHHGRRNRSRRYRSRGTDVEAEVMNFIKSDLGSPDSEIIESVNLNMLRVREQDAARKGTRHFAWVGANGNEQFSCSCTAA